jgi:hypothetical protein
MNKPNADSQRSKDSKDRLRFEAFSFGSICIGAGALPVMKEVKQEAHRREVELTIVPTVEAIKTLQENPAHTNAILHVTC